jgi:hypothetical protein
VKLRERWWEAHRIRPPEAEFKPPQAASVKSSGRECMRKVRLRPGEVSMRETNTDESLLKRRKAWIASKPKAFGSFGISLSGILGSG